MARPTFRLCLVGVALILFSPALLRAAAPASPPKIRIILVGDSTVTDNAGWGSGFKQLVDPARAEVINLARGGRSSMSYIKEGLWAKALALKADYYLIQFGHNDEPGKPGRSTSLEDYRHYMTRYVEETRAIGAHPVLVTSLVRRQFDRHDDHLIHSSLAPRAAIVKEIAAVEHVPLVDLHARSLALCERLGREACLEFSPLKTVHGKTAHDGTHLNAKGHLLFARLVVDELRRAVPALDPVLLSNPLSPTATAVHADAVVAADGSGTFTTVQAAIAAAPAHAARPYVILIKPGVYQGQIIIPKDKPFLHLVGEDATRTILTYGLNVREMGLGTNPAFKGTGVVILSDDVTADNLTFRNTSGDHGQALALRVDGDRETFRHCRLLGWQDTLMLNRGRDYLDACYVEGRVDFIYGSATAVFDRCEIHSKNGGHVTAANTPADHPFGFVFLHCRLTDDPKPWDPSKTTRRPPLADLGRPWRPYAQVAYIECYLGPHIKPSGWNNWGNPANEKAARYSEYRDFGPGANPEARAPWSHQLTSAQARSYTVDAILGGDDHWHPDGIAPTDERG